MRVQNMLATALVPVLTLLAPAASAPLKIMPLGDSRTSGPDSRNCYRLYLDRLLSAAGYSYDFVGTKHGHNWDDTAPDSIFDPDHEGHWGWPVNNLVWFDYIKVGAGAWTRETMPDIVLALLGMADVINEADSFNVRADRTIDEMRQLIDTLRSVNPNIIVLLANQYPVSPVQVVPPLPDVIDTLNARVPALVESTNTVESPVIFVDTWTGFNWRTDLCDGTHANRPGSIKVANAWMEKLWPFFDSIPPAVAARAVAGPLRLAEPTRPAVVFADLMRSCNGIFTVTGRSVVLRSSGAGSLPDTRTWLPAVRVP